MVKKTTAKAPKQVETLKHDEASRKNIPTAEFRSVLEKQTQDPLRASFERRNRDLDPQLVWRGKDERDWSDLVVPAPPLFIQEKVHPKVLIDDLVRRSARAAGQAPGFQTDLFADFNGVPEGDAKTEFYQHDANWSNRMILGDSLQVMASLAEREGLRGQVQCIYLDPPYGIKFNSNFQWSTTSRDVKDGNTEHITREPEQVKAFRDTWRDGIHSYLTYLRDRLTVARDLLTESGSIFVQIGDENVHRVRAVMDEVFGEANCCCVFTAQKTGGLSQSLVPNTSDYLLWYCKNIIQVKFRQLYLEKSRESVAGYNFVDLPDGQRMSITAAQNAGLDVKSGRYYQPTSVESANPRYAFSYQGVVFNHRWKTHPEGLRRLAAASRFHRTTNSLRYVRFIADFPVVPLTSVWTDTGAGSFLEEQIYVVQTVTKIAQRCILMTTDPGDLVLDPTCGSGTTAYVAEQWGRRWITIDTSRVALALARARIMGARYPFYYLADSRDGQIKDAEVRRTTPSEAPTRGDLRQGFVYERVPHVTLKSIANNAEIDVLWEKHQAILEPLRQSLNAALGKGWEEWQIPRETEPRWPAEAKELHARWWEGRIARQRDIDASIARNADEEYLYDKPYPDPRKARVAGPFTVESLSPHRVMSVDENDELIDPIAQAEGRNGETRDFDAMILENLRTSGVQQAHKEDRIVFTSLKPWPGDLVYAEGRYLEAETEKRAAIFIGPEFGTVTRPDLVAAAREAGDADFDVLIACAFNYEAHASEFNKLGRIPVLKARMNADLHMAGELKNTGKGNLFVIFGEPDIDILPAEDGQVRVKINGVDVFHPNTGEVRSDSAEGIACWFIDTDYDEESFFVRHAYFLGANDPYKALKTTLKAEIDEEAWATLRSDTSRPFEKPRSGRIAVKVINHLGDEVMKVFRVV
jgi:adenine-specific DNA-methyltransferase